MPSFFRSPFKIRRRKKQFVMYVPYDEFARLQHAITQSMSLSRKTGTHDNKERTRGEKKNIGEKPALLI